MTGITHSSPASSCSSDASWCKRHAINWSIEKGPGMDTESLFRRFMPVTRKYFRYFDVGPEHTFMSYAYTCQLDEIDISEYNNVTSGISLDWTYHLWIKWHVRWSSGKFSTMLKSHGDRRHIWIAMWYHCVNQMTHSTRVPVKVLFAIAKVRVSQSMTNYCSLYLKLLIFA